MTEQGLIEYAKKGDIGAIAHLDAGGFAGVDWRFAITHINGGWLPGNEIKRVWDEMVKIKDGSSMSMEEISTGLQKALNVKHDPLKISDLATTSPAGRPWDFNFKHKVKFGKGSSRTPPKKKRK